MKLHKILPIIFFMIAMMISCSQEAVINENISEEATTPDTKICVNIKTENSRTVRPEITKWEITVTNKSDANLTFSRTIDGKATSATFVNITAGEYEITVRGIHEDSNRKTIILTANPTFEVKPNTVNVCEIIPEDFFPDPIINNDGTSSTPAGNLNIQISGLTDLFSKGETLLLTCTKLGSNDKTSKSETLPYEYTNGTLIREITEIPVGSYKIEITHNDEAKTKTKVNLVKDPVVNIYPETTTEINWEWNYDSDEINTDQDLKGIKIPVWNKSISNYDFLENSIPARNGYLTANALFAEPTWDEEESYNFEYTDEYTDEEGKTTTTIYTSEIPASEFDFINCAYDNIGNLWVLSGTKSSIPFYSENDEPYVERFCYVLKNLSTDEDYKFIYTDSLNQDFTVFDDGTNKYLIVSSMSDNGDGKKLKSFKLSGTEIKEIDSANSPTDLTNITALYISRNSNTDEIPIYIATTLRGNANIYTGTISTGDTLTLDININQPLLSLDINSFINNDGNFSFYNSAFMISDMYINEDKSKLYVTAGCVSYNYKSWYYNDYSNGVYHSFGGLFEYDLNNNYNLLEAYGVYNGNNANSPFLIDDSGKIRLADNIIQATNDDSSYFAGPRYIIPSGNDLLIVDSGFYGLVDKTPGTNNPFSLYGKQNRIFTFNIKEKNDESEGLIFNSITTLDDSISFDYDYLTSSSRY